MEPNALHVVLRAVLLQQYNDGLQPVAYISKKYILAEGNHAPNNNKLSTIFKAYQKWTYYLGQTQNHGFYWL